MFWCVTANGWNFCQIFLSFIEISFSWLISKIACIMSSWLYLKQISSSEFVCSIFCNLLSRLKTLAHDRVCFYLLGIMSSTCSLMYFLALCTILAHIIQFVIICRLKWYENIDNKVDCYIYLPIYYVSTAFSRSDSNVDHQVNFLLLLSYFSWS